MNSLKKSLPALFLCLVLLLPLQVQAREQAARILRDQLNRKVLVPEKPSRVITLAPSLTECVFALNQGHKVVGVTRFSNYPSAAQSLPKVGSYIHLDLEKIVALQPDLCLATRDGNPLQVIKRLQEFDLPVFVLDPRNLQTLLHSIEQLGNLLGADKQAQKIIQNISRRKQSITSRLQHSGSCPGVFFQIGVSPIVSVGSDTLIHELINLAGGRNLAAGPKTYPRFSREDVLMLKPDIILISSMQNRENLLQEVKDQWNRYKSIPAVADQRIYAVDSDYYNRASPRLIQGLENLAKIIHPTIFKE